jgi:hypothetical protein
LSGRRAKSRVGIIRNYRELTQKQKIEERKVEKGREAGTSHYTG